jgi:hypothetical protein
MKKITVPLIIIVLSACSPKWNKEYAKKTCITAASKETNQNEPTKKMIEKLCDCTAEKLVANYKTEAAANKDTKNVEAISLGCIKDIYSSPSAESK